MLDVYCYMCAECITLHVQIERRCQTTFSLSSMSLPRLRKLVSGSKTITQDMLSYSLLKDPFRITSCSVTSNNLKRWLKSHSVKPA